MTSAQMSDADELPPPTVRRDAIRPPAGHVAFAEPPLSTRLAATSYAEGVRDERRRIVMALRAAVKDDDRATFGAIMTYATKIESGLL